MKIKSQKHLEAITMNIKNILQFKLYVKSEYS